MCAQTKKVYISHVAKHVFLGFNMSGCLAAIMVGLRRVVVVEAGLA
jgi:hypothetical protein